MREFFRSCVQVYATLTGSNPDTYPRVPTPFGPEIGVEDGLSGPKGSVDVAPAMEALKECLEACDSDAAPAHPDVPDRTQGGILQPISAKVLMNILYGARMARPDLLRAVCHTASCVTKWNEQNDLDLYRLVRYIRTTVDYTQV